MQLQRQTIRVMKESHHLAGIIIHTDWLTFTSERCQFFHCLLRSISFISVANYTATFRKYRVNSWSSVCPHGRSYFSFSRISSALVPLASSFFNALSASAFLASSAAFASAFAFFASKDATSFSAFFRAVFLSFRSVFKVSILAVMDAISVFREVIASCFSYALYHEYLTIIPHS